MEDSRDGCTGRRQGESRKYFACIQPEENRNPIEAVFPVLSRFVTRYANLVIPGFLFSAALISAACRPVSSMPETASTSIPHFYVTTLAGTGSPGKEDGRGVDSRFFSPTGMILSPYGNLIIADRDNHCMRWTTPIGETHTWGTCGTAGFGDGSVETARFRTPAGLALAPDTSVIVADAGNHAVRRITMGGTVTTIAGSGTAGFRDGSIGVALFSSPSAVAVDKNGVIFVADTGNHRIRMIEGDTVSTFAGDGTPGDDDGPRSKARFRNPTGLGFDRDGVLVLSDTGNHVMRKIGSDGRVTTLTSTQKFSSPSALAFAPDGRIYVGDESRLIVLLSGGSPAGSAGTSPGGTDGGDSAIRFGKIAALVFDDSGNLYASDTTNHAIRKITPSGSVTTISGRRSAGFMESAPHLHEFLFPAGIAAGSDGTLIVADTYNHRIRRMLPGGRMETLAGTTSEGYADGVGENARFAQPRGVTVDDQGNVFVADTVNHVIRKITPNRLVTTHAGSGVMGYLDGPAGTARFNAPFDVALDKAGNMFVADYGNHSIRRISPDGIVSTFAGDGIQGFIDGKGKAARLYRPSGIAFDTDGHMWITDPHNHSVRHITPDAVVTTVAGAGVHGYADGTGRAAYFYFPSRLIVSGLDLLVAEEFGHRIRRVERSGRTTVYAGNGNPGWRDGRADASRFFSPFSIASDKDGFMYVIDTYNQCVRIIVP